MQEFILLNFKIYYSKVYIIMIIYFKLVLGINSGHLT